MENPYPKRKRWSDFAFRRGSSRGVWHMRMSKSAPTPHSFGCLRSKAWSISRLSAQALRSDAHGVARNEQCRPTMPPLRGVGDSPTQHRTVAHRACAVLHVPRAWLWPHLEIAPRNGLHHYAVAGSESGCASTSFAQERKPPPSVGQQSRPSPTKHVWRPR